MNWVVFMEGFGQRVKKELKEQGMQQKNLCLYLNVNKSTMCEWLNDKNEPPMHIIVGIAEYLGVTTDYLLGREG